MTSNTNAAPELKPCQTCGAQPVVMQQCVDNGELGIETLDAYNVVVKEHVVAQGFNTRELAATMWDIRNVRADTRAVPDGSRVIFLLIEKLCNEAGAEPDSVARNLETIRALARDSASDGDNS